MAVDSGLVPFLFSLCFYLTIGPFLLLIVIANEIIRLIISLFLHLKYGDDIYLVSDGNDGMWTTERKSSTRMVVIGCRFHGKFKRSTIMELFKEKIYYDMDPATGTCLNGRLEKILIKKFGYACWKEDRNFDYENHIKFLPEDKVLDKQDVEKLLEEYGKEMPASRPQWEFIVMNRYREESEESETGWVFCRFNHGYCDGLSANMFLKRYIFPNFNPIIDPLKFNIPFKKKFLFYLNAAIFSPYTAFIFFKNRSTEFWPKVKGSYPKRSYRWTEEISMDNIRLIRKVMDNTTIPSVVENAFISAVIQILPGNRIPNEWVIGEVAAVLPYPDQILRNRFTAFNYSINSLDDEWTRLKKSKEAAWQGMTGPFILLFYYAFYFVGRMPVALHKFLLRGSASAFLFSNVPVSRTKITGVDGVEAIEFLGFPPQANDTGITVGCSTYLNSLKLMATSQSDCLSETELDMIIKRIPKIIEEWANYAEKEKLRPNGFK